MNCTGGAGGHLGPSIVGGLAVGLLGVVVLCAFDGCPRFIEQRVGTREVATVERVLAGLAGVLLIISVGGVAVEPVPED